MRIPLLLLFICFIFTTANAQSFVFAQLTGAPVNTTGWNLTGNAFVGNSPVGAGNSEIILTNPSNSQSGAVFCTQPINIVQCDKWTVDFEFRIWDGSAADGIAFCLLDVPPSGFVGGGGVGIPAASNGLKVVFDTYNNCGAANPAIQIRWGAGYNGGECNYAQPTLDNSGQLSFIRSNIYNTARVEYDAGQIDVYVNNTLYLSGFYVINFTTYAGFTASTGGANDRHSIRNVVIRTDMAQPHAYTGPNASTCSGQPLQIGGATDPTYQYHWTPTTGLDDPTISNPTLTLTNNTNAPQVIKYKVGANIIGSTCTQYDSVLITVYPIPTADFGSDKTSYCLSDNAIITYAGTATASATYNWNFDGGTIISGSGQGPYTINWPTSGAKNLSLTVTENGCTSPSFPLQVTVYDYPASTFSITPAACPNANANVQYTGLAASTATYNWNFGGGAVNSGAGQGPYTVSWPSPGSQSVTLTVTENGCSSTQTQNNILIYTPPTANFAAQSPVCAGLPSQVLYTGTGTAAAIYNWNWNGGTATPTGNENYNVSWNGAGLKTIDLTVTENGCQSLPFSQNITVYPIPTANFSATPQTVCQYEDVQISYSGSASNLASYNWNWLGGHVSPGTNQNYSVNWDLSGTYPVVLVVSENGCQSLPYVQVIEVKFQPTADFTTDPSVCVNTPLTITYSGLGLGTANYTWDVDGGTLTGSGQGPITTTWASEGNKTITLTIDEGGCIATGSQNVTVNPLPKIMLEPSYNICLGEEINLDPGSFVDYLWNNGSTDRFTIAELAGLYQVTVTDINGCVNTGFTSVTDTVCLSLFIPNAFTPNGDKLNDVFKPVIEYPIDYTMRVYNRWGELLFASINDSEASWDGTENGKLCQPDVYIYYIEFSGYQNQRIVKGIKKGTVSLIR